ncbi:hypothetical protein K457DRAFT_1882513, partial [Linnemannia elongata AG-77]
RIITEEGSAAITTNATSSTSDTSNTSDTSRTSGISDINANVNASGGSNSTTVPPAPCGSARSHPVDDQPSARLSRIIWPSLDDSAKRCSHMDAVSKLPVGIRLCVWNDAAEFSCLRCLGLSMTAVCLSRTISIPGSLPPVDCCPLVRSARRNHHLRNYFPKCYEGGCRVCPSPLQQQGPPIDPRCWTVILERKRVDFYLRCQNATTDSHQKSFAELCKNMDNLSAKIKKSYPYLNHTQYSTLMRLTEASNANFIQK